jgi:DNA polymerase-3 subunit delta
MKIQAYQVDKFIKDIESQKNLKGVVIYGPDEGLVNLRYKEVLSKIVKDTKDPFAVTILYDSQVKERPQCIAEEFVSISMFGGRKAIVIKDAKNTVAELLRGVEGLAGDNFLIVLAGELDTKSALRKFAEASPCFASLPCYVDDEKSMRQVVSGRLNELGFKYDVGVVDVFIEKFGGNRLIMMNEIEKVVTFMGEDRELSVDVLEGCVKDVSETQIDELVNVFADLNIERTVVLLDKLLSENVNFVVILRSLMNYFMRLQLVKGLVVGGREYTEALQELRPPLFFKQIPLFKKHIGEWKLEDINLFLDRLNEAEAKCKSLKIDTGLYLGNFLNTALMFFRKKR